MANMSEEEINRISSLKELSEGLDRIMAERPISARPKFTVLDEDGNLVPATLMEWAMWFEGGRQRIIQQDYFMNKDYKVSTVFLGMDHSWSPVGPGHYFETMVFGPSHEMEILDRVRSVRDDLWVQRCETLAQAKSMHAAGVRWLKQQDFYNE
jgi:hypothetical protein